MWSSEKTFVAINPTGYVAYQVAHVSMLFKRLLSSHYQQHSRQAVKRSKCVLPIAIDLSFNNQQASPAASRSVGISEVRPFAIFQTIALPTLCYTSALLSTVKL